MFMSRRCTAIQEMLLASILGSISFVKANERTTREESTTEFDPEASTPQDGHLSGGLPMISDSAFSLVILIYVSVAFGFVFFLFCWKSETVIKVAGNRKLQRQCILMTNAETQRKHSDLPESDAMLRAPESFVIPPTPTPSPPAMTNLMEEDEE